MVLCVVVGCSKRSQLDKDVSFYEIPKIIINRCEKTRVLCENRKNGLVAANSRRDFSYGKKLSSRRNMLSTKLLCNACSTNVIILTFHKRRNEPSGSVPAHVVTGVNNDQIVLGGLCLPGC